MEWTDSNVRSPFSTGVSPDPGGSSAEWQHEYNGSWRNDIHTIIGTRGAGIGRDIVLMTEAKTQITINKVWPTGKNLMVSSQNTGYRVCADRDEGRRGSK